MVFQVKIVFRCDLQLNLLNFRHNKFFNSSAVHADQMVMVFSGRDVLVVLHRLAKVVLRQLAGFHHEGDYSVDCGPGDLALPVFQSLGQGIHREVGPEFEHLFGHQQSLVRYLQIPAFQEIGKIGKLTMDICCSGHG